MAEKHFSIIAILSFIFGALGVLLEHYMLNMHWIVALFLPIMAIIFGFISLNQIKQDKELFGSVFVILGIMLGCFEILSLLLSQLSLGFKWLVG